MSETQPAPDGAAIAALCLAVVDTEGKTRESFLIAQPFPADISDIEMTAWLEKATTDFQSAMKFLRDSETRAALGKAIRS